MQNTNAKFLWKMPRLLALFLVFYSVLFSSQLLATEIYGGITKSSLGPDEKNGLVVGIGHSLNAGLEGLQVGFYAEYIQKGRKGYFSKFNVSTGEVGYQGEGELTIGYFQPSIVLRGDFFKGPIRPVGYFGVGLGMVLHEHFEEFDPVTEPSGGSEPDYSDGVGLAGISVYIKNLVFDVRYSKNLGKYSQYDDTLQLTVGFTFYLEGGLPSDVR